MQRTTVTALLTAALALSAGSARADAVDTLKKFNAQSNGVSGSFSQTVSNKKGTKSASGQFAILRPGYFKWDITAPYKQQIIGDSKTVWLYDKDLNQVTKRAQGAALGASPVAILADKGALERSYTLKADGNNGGIDYVRATPKNSNAGYKFIRIGFKGDSLAAMQMQDSFGNSISVSFSGVNMHPSLSPAQFKFSPPAGADVLSN